MLNRPSNLPKLRLNSCKNFIVFFKELLPYLRLFIVFF